MYLWNKESKSYYLYALLDIEAQQQMANLNELVDSTNVDSNVLVDRLTNILYYILLQQIKPFLFIKVKFPVRESVRKNPNG